MDLTDVLFCYTTALHWSLTQFTPASMEVHPHNSAERIFTVLVLILALILFSAFVSSTTAALTRLRNLNVEQKKQRAMLRTYFSQNEVSLDLGNRIWSYFQTNHYAFKRRVHEADIHILGLLPPSMLELLHEEVFAPCLMEHPFFMQCSMVDGDNMRMLCHTAVTEVFRRMREEIFSKGNKAGSMYFILTGRLGYIRKRDKLIEYENGRDMEVTQMLEQGTWACEAALWVHWMHMGWLVSHTPVELALVDAVKAQAALGKSVKLEIWDYAHSYFQVINERRGGDEPVTDVWDDFDAIWDITQVAFDVMPEQQQQQPLFNKIMSMDGSRNSGSRNSAARNSGLRSSLRKSQEGRHKNSKRASSPPAAYVPDDPQQQPTSEATLS